MLHEDLASRQVLVVEDERNIRDLVCSHLESENYQCEAVADGPRALALVEQRRFDVVVLDLMLPGADGLAVCRAIRTGKGPNREVPILMLTARREEQDKVAGFGEGADDYLTKPFSMKELTCRVAALTRRARRAGADVDPLATAEPLTVGSLYLDPVRRTVRVRGADVAVTPHEFRLLHKLASAPGAVFTRERLLAEIWEGEAFVTARSIDTLVYRLRCKIERDPAAPTSIITVWGDGYKFTNVAP
jgi:DNA-binding response OmpR family regulator